MNQGLITFFLATLENCVNYEKVAVAVNINVDINVVVAVAADI